MSEAFREGRPARIAARLEELETDRLRLRKNFQDAPANSPEAMRLSRAIEIVETSIREYRAMYAAVCGWRSE